MSKSEISGRLYSLNMDVAVLRNFFGAGLAVLGALARNSMSSCQRMIDFSEIVLASLFARNFWYSFRKSVRVENRGLMLYPVLSCVIMPRAFSFFRCRQRVFLGNFVKVFPDAVSVWKRISIVLPVKMFCQSI